MKKLILIVAILTFSLGFSQSEKISKAEVLSTFKTAYNASNFSAIYNLLSEDFKSKKDLKSITNYLKRFKNAKGEITNISSNGIENDGYIKYPITVGKLENKLVLKYNNKNKLEYISFN